MLHQPQTYSVDSQFQVTIERPSDKLARAKYIQSIGEKGYNQLHIFANRGRTLLQQHQGAGFLEGYLTYREIHSAYVNLHRAVIKTECLSQSLLNFLREQLHYIEAKIKQNPGSLFWQYAQAYLVQLRYMYRGYLVRLDQEHSPDLLLTFDQFYCLTNVGDFADLIPAFHDQSQMFGQIQAPDVSLGNCNGYVTVLDGQVCIVHSTHNTYEFLLRIVKNYHFPTDSPEVGSTWLSFTSRPGDIRSKDDFYVLSSGLVVIETSLSNQNVDNYQDLRPQTVPSWLRVCIAANLSKNCADWQSYFLQESSGTHNNQWVIVDTNKVESSQGFVVCVEEGFSQSQVTDMSQLLRQKGYIASYNIPCSQKIFRKLGYQKYPFTYDNEPRAIECYQYHSYRISSVADMKKWFLTNQNDNVKRGLAPRYDLSLVTPKPFGLTDCKIVTGSYLKARKFQIISGPSTSNGRFPAFDWKHWPQHSHVGMPDVWDFGWQEVTVQQSLFQQQKGDSANVSI